MSLAGFWAGLGDAARSENQRREKEATARRDAFADDLGRIMESTEWPEAARVTAGQMRQRLFSDTKIKPKDYEKMWESVRQASGRPGQPSAELAAARSDVPAMQSLRTNMGGTGGVPAAQPDGLTMRGPGSSMDLLRPTEAPAVPGTSTFLNLRPAGTPEPSLVSPPSMAQAADTRLSAAQHTIATTPPPTTVYGPRTRAENSREAMDLFQQQQGLQLDTYRKQKEIDAELRPDKFAFGADGALVLNQATGEFEPTGVTKPENLTEMESAVQDWMAERQLPDTPQNRNAARKEIRELNSMLGRDPNVAAMRDMQFAALQSERLSRFDRDQRDYQLQASAKVRALYEDDIKDAKVALPFVQSLRASAARATRGADFYLLYNAVRVADPNSVVREGELRLLESLLSTWANAAQKINKISGSERALADEARKMALDLADLAEQRGQMLLTSAKARAEALAGRHGVDPGLVGIVDYGGNGALKPKVYPPWQMPNPTRPGLSANGAHITRSDASEATRPPGAFLKGLVDILNTN